MTDIEVERDPSAIIARACHALAEEERETASQILRQEYPFQPIATQVRQYTKQKRAEIFTRDGFIDRYTGRRLVYQPVLGVLSYHFPQEFPAHSNWKMSVSHYAFWELSPTLDHVVPIARGGTNEDSNLITSSLLSNARKGNFSLEEMGWKLHPAGPLDQWDGLMGWFVHYVEQHPGSLDYHYPAGEIASWYKIAARLLSRAASAR